jgi:ribokinase
MSERVIVVGSVNIDLVVRCAALPRPGETVAGGTFSTHGGGKGANAAVAAARYGVETLLIGAVGDDSFGAPRSGGGCCYELAELL